jgi:hypothetical protein
VRLIAQLVVGYFAYDVRSGASARRAAHRVAHRQLLRLSRASECLSMSRGSLRGSSTTISPTSRVRVPRHVARLVTWLVVVYFDYTAARRVARRQLLRLCRASGRTVFAARLFVSQSHCSRRAPGHSVSRLDYSVRRDFVLRTHWLHIIHVVRRDYLSRDNTGSTSSTSRAPNN